MPRREREKERQCGVILIVLVAFICVYLDVYALWGCVPGDELELCQAEDTTPYKDKSCWRFRLPAGWYSCRVRVPQLWELQPDGVQKPDVLEWQIFAGIGCTGKYICFLQSLTSIKRHTTNYTLPSQITDLRFFLYLTAQSAAYQHLCKCPVD